MGRKIDSGLEEEYNEQYRQDTINVATGNWDEYSRYNDVMIKEK